MDDFITTVSLIIHSNVIYVFQSNIMINCTYTILSKYQYLSFCVYLYAYFL